MQVGYDVIGHIQFFYKIFGGNKSFCGTTDTPVVDFSWCLSWVSKPGWIPCMLSHLCDPQIHLWCDICWVYRGQHGSWAFLMYILADVSTSIGGDLEPTTVCAARNKHSTVNYSTTSARLDISSCQDVGCFISNLVLYLCSYLKSYLSLTRVALTASICQTVSVLLSHWRPFPVETSKPLLLQRMVLNILFNYCLDGLIGFL